MLGFLFLQECSSSPRAPTLYPFVNRPFTNPDPVVDLFTNERQDLRAHATDADDLDAGSGDIPKKTKVTVTPHAFKALFCSNADTVVVTIGSSNANTKTGSVPGGYAYSKFVSITNWAGTDTYPDMFAVTQSGTSLSVKRTDAPGAGLGMDLRFYCTAGFHPSCTRPWHACIEQSCCSSNNPTPVIKPS